jgi:hypothetical protein
MEDIFLEEGGVLLLNLPLNGSANTADHNREHKISFI